jgi:anti-sigma factor RsiW
MNEHCPNLDNYLLGDLSPADEATFAEHLHDCDDCREAIEEQHWINNLLQASSRLETEAPPPYIARELRVVAASRESHRNHAVAIALATAAALLVAVTWLLNHPTGTLPEHLATTNQIPNTPEPPHALFVAGSGAIAVPVESRHPDVTIVRIYSTFQPANNSKMAAFEPESINLNNLTDFSNGG